MKTKIVYVLVSNGEGVYVEQLYVSLVSLKLHSPNSSSCVVVNNDTERLLKKSNIDILSYIDDLISIDVPSQFVGAKCSRYLKTSLRKYITGPYLFVDTDTVIAEPLDDIDEFIDSAVDVAAVRDAHCAFKEMPTYYQVADRFNKIGWDSNCEDEIHFNSGVMFVADNDKTHEFYRQWHENWLFELTKGLYFDQPALARTNRVLGNVITEMEGMWNYQLFWGALMYLYGAKIIHYGGTARDTEAYYFRQLHVLNDINRCSQLPTETLEYIKHPKEAFVGQMKILGEGDFMFFRSNLHNAFLYHPRRYAFYDSIEAFLCSVATKIKKYLK